MLSARSPTTNWKAMENAKDLGGFRVGGLVGDPGTGGLNLFTSSKSLSMNIESPKFPGTSSNSIIYLYSGSSPDSRIEFTRTSWLGWGVFVKQQLNGPIRDNVFSLSYWGMQGPEDTDLFNNLAHENIYGLYASGNAHVANCTCDRNDTGLEVNAVSGKTLHIRDSLFTANADEGILIDSGSGDVANYYNAFWNNGQEIDGGQVGPGSQVLPPKGASPYYNSRDTEWQLRYKLKQSSSLVDAGSRSARYARLNEYSTSVDADRDVKDLDIGYHWATGQYAHTDDDGMPDVWEQKWFGGLSRDGSGHYDGDNLKDLDEYLNGTFPDDSNSDDDDLDDNEEVMRGGGARDRNFPRGPYLHLVWENEQTKMAVRWRTATAKIGAIRYRKETEAWSEPVVGSSTTEHEVKTSALDPDTLYFYEVGYMKKGTTYERQYGIRHFWTPPEEGGNFEFIVYGDNRGGDDEDFREEHAKVVAGILQQTGDPRFIIHVGDLVHDGGEEGQWNPQFFWPAQALLEISPLFPTLGNHEYRGDENAANYKAYFTLPDVEPEIPGDAERWYSFDYGDCHLICLDVYDVSDFDNGEDDQREWLAADLEGASGQRLFVWFHNPPFSSGWHGKDENDNGRDVREHLVPIFQDEGVKMVFTGHDHLYERAACTYLGSTVRYIVTGGGGAPLVNGDDDYAYPEPPTPPDGQTTVQEKLYDKDEDADGFHFCVVGVTAPAFQFKMYKWDGSPEDQWPE